MMNNVQIEIIEMYVLYGKPNTKMVYNVHVYIKTPDIDLDLRGYNVHVHSENNRHLDHVYPPMQKQYDREEKKGVLFPVLNTNLNNLEVEIKNLILKKARKKFATQAKIPNLPTSYQKYLEQMKKPKLQKFNKRAKRKLFCEFPPSSYEFIIKK